MTPSPYETGQLYRVYISAGRESDGTFIYWPIGWCFRDSLTPTAYSLLLGALVYACSYTS